jgi:hypothetical protein
MFELEHANLSLLLIIFERTNTLFLYIDIEERKMQVISSGRLSDEKGKKKQLQRAQLNSTAKLTYNNQHAPCTTQKISQTPRIYAMPLHQT